MVGELMVVREWSFHINFNMAREVKIVVEWTCLPESKV